MNGPTKVEFIVPADRGNPESDVLVSLIFGLGSDKSLRWQAESLPTTTSQTAIYALVPRLNRAIIDELEKRGYTGAVDHEASVIQEVGTVTQLLDFRPSINEGHQGIQTEKVLRNIERNTTPPNAVIAATIAFSQAVQGLGGYVLPEVKAAEEGIQKRSGQTQRPPSGSKDGP